MRIRERVETGSTENGEKEAYTGIRFSSPPAFSRERANERKINWCFLLVNYFFVLKT